MPTGCPWTLWFTLILVTIATFMENATAAAAAVAAESLRKGKLLAGNTS